MFSDKFEFEEMKQIFIKGLENVPRHRHKLVSYFGTQYFKPMDDAEWKSKQREVFIKVEGIQNKI